MLKNGIDNILEYLNKNNISNFFLIDYPFQCSKKNFYKALIFKNFDTCKDESLFFEQNNASYFEFINYLKFKYHKDTKFKNPSKYFCSKEECNLLLDGKLIFYDTAIHLTEDGIKYLTTKLPKDFFF
tara:strand:- start:94 stop:474 length:381 start_codon:yes stop_codon:yes gene_type:complete